MINKIYKRIHNKYLSLFKFIFFLRYLFGVFFISIVLFLLSPHFFDYKKKDDKIKNYVSAVYGFNIEKYDSIQFSALPTPHLKINNAKLKNPFEAYELNVKNLKIFPRLFSIYNYNNFQLKKMIVNDSKIILKDTDLKNFVSSILNLNKKIIFSDLNIIILRNKKPLINLKQIFFSNYGYKKNQFTGEVFNQKFKIILNEDYSEINFKLLKSGIDMEIFLDEKKTNSITKGVVKSKFLNSRFKFNFDIDRNELKISNSFFRSKELSFKNESLIKFKPFFDSISTFYIQDIDIKLIKKLDLNKFFSSSELIKRLNTKNTIIYKSKKFSKGIIDSLTLKSSLAYGKIIYDKEILISKNIIKCRGEINLLLEYPILSFNCLISSEDKMDLLKNFSVKYKNKNELLRLKFSGNLNILNNKINFKSIFLNEDYKASDEDLKYFKNTFERLLFDESFINIFNYKKIKEFILEIS